MTPAQIIALARDGLIIAALAFVVWRIYTDGQNAVKVQDIQAVQKQIQANAQIQAQWSQEAQKANEQRTQDMAKVSAAIASHSAPIFVRNAPGTCTLPATTAPTVSQPASAGIPDPGAGKDSGSSVNIREQINSFEMKYEAALADCRAALSSWPTNGLR